MYIGGILKLMILNMNGYNGIVKSVE
jgi:hypothetical protein